MLTASVIRHRSKPCAAASALTKAVSFSRRRKSAGERSGAWLEIEICIIRYRGQAPNPFGQKRPEGGARFQPLVPVLGDRRFSPLDLAEIVKDRDRSRCREVGIGEAVARQPWP